jgi:adenosine deaminase
MFRVMDRLPLVELHVHLEGTLEPALIFELAERNAIRLPYTLPELRELYEFTDLQSFLDLYYANLAVVITAHDFADITRAYLARAATAGVRHVELFIDPQAHLSRGIDLAVIMDGITGVTNRAEQDFGLSASVIVCFLRDRPAVEALDILQQLIDISAPIIGIGLDSAEVGHPPSDFAAVFELAASAGLHRVAHAGEEGPPDYVWQALDILGAERIDHGIRSLEDETLIARLVKDRIPLTVCPLSNVRLRVVDTIRDHPLPAMLEHGLAVVVNSDDPAYFGGYIDDNFDALTSTFGFPNETLALLAHNGVDAAFISNDRRAALHADIDRWLDLGSR